MDQQLKQFSSRFEIKNSYHHFLFFFKSNQSTSHLGEHSIIDYIEILKCVYLLNQLLQLSQEMNNNKTKTVSSLSADSTEIRYQKALKQINKLIAVNTEIRDETYKNQQTINQLYHELQTKGNQLAKTLQQNNYLQKELLNVNNEKSTIFYENQQLKKQNTKLKSLKTQKQPSKVPKKQYKDSSQSSLILKEQDIEKNSNNELEKFVFYNLNTNTTNKDDPSLNNKSIKKQMNNIDGLSAIDFGQECSEIAKNSSIIIEINNKLIAANQYIQKLSDECVHLKMQVDKLQNLNTILTMQNRNNHASNNKKSPQLSPRSYNIIPLETNNSAEVLKRYHKLEQQNKKISKKYQTTRLQLDQLNNNYLKLLKDNKIIKQQVSSYQQLTEKQQNIISQLHQDFDQQVIKMTNVFKQKLEQQRESFGSNKIKDNAKLIQTLQSENKSLKKKFQLCSIELTKCFKTLEIYKTKINQCQKDYSQLLNQKVQLVEKLAKIQNNNNSNINNNNINFPSNSNSSSNLHINKNQQILHKKSNSRFDHNNNDRASTMEQTAYFSCK